MDSKKSFKINTFSTVWNQLTEKDAAKIINAGESLL